MDVRRGKHSKEGGGGRERVRSRMEGQRKGAGGQGECVHGWKGRERGGIRDGGGDEGEEVVT